MTTAPKQIKPPNLPSDLLTPQIFPIFKRPHKVFSLIRPHFAISQRGFSNFPLALRPNRSQLIPLKGKVRMASWRDCNTTVQTTRAIFVKLDDEKMKNQVSDLRIGFKRMKCLRSIFLGTSWCFRDNISLSKYFKILAKAMRTLHDLRTFSRIQNVLEDGFTGNWIPILLALRSIKRPENLFLYKTSAIKIPFLNTFSFLPRNLATVQTLGFYFNSGITISPEKILSFFSSLKSIRKIDIIQMDKQDKLTRNILLGLKGLEELDAHLEYLKIDIKNLEEDDLELINSSTLLKNLKKLSISSTIPISRKSMVFELIGRLTKIQNCKVDFPEFKINSHQRKYSIRIEEYAQKTINWTHLKDFNSMIELSVNVSKTLTVDFSDIISALKSCQSLQAFILEAPKLDIKIGVNKPNNTILDPNMNRLDGIIEESVVLKTERILEKQAVVNVQWISTPEEFLKIFESVENLNFTLLKIEQLQYSNSTVIEKLTKCLYRNTELKQFKFVTYKNMEFEGYIEMLKGGLHHWKSLESVQINDSSRFIKLENLQNLIVHLRINDGLAIKSITIIRELVAQLSNLKKFELEFTKSEGHDNILYYLQELLKNPQKMNNLQEFSFSQEIFSTFGSEGVLMLCEFLSQISPKTLNILKINLGYAGDIKLKAFETLIEKIGGFAELKVITLDLSMEKVVNARASKDLEIEPVDKCTCLSDKELKVIGDLFKSLNKLEEIDMNFENNSVITGGQVKGLIGICEGLVNLKKVDIGFKGCKKVRQIDLKGLVELKKKLGQKIEKSDEEF